MKKIFMLLAITAFFAGTTSCKKDYQCDCSGIVVDYPGLDKDEALAAEAACDAAGCTWSVK